jgi:hypothetical protein
MHVQLRAGIGFLARVHDVSAGVQLTCQHVVADKHTSWVVLRACMCIKARVHLL